MASVRITNMDRGYDDVSFESEMEQAEYGDCLKEGFVPNLPRIYSLNAARNDPSDLLKIWDQWDDDRRQRFTEKFGDIALLLAIKIDEPMIQTMLEFWDPTHRCFSLNNTDLTPTIKEYAVLLRLNLSEEDKIYIKENKSGDGRRKLTKFFERNFFENNKCSVKKGNRICMPVSILLNLIDQNDDDKRTMNAFALAVYGLFIFPRIQDHVDFGVLDFVMRLNTGINPVPTIVAETIRALNVCRIKGTKRFTGCLSLLHIWIRSHILLEKCMSKLPHEDIPILNYYKKTLENTSCKRWMELISMIEGNNIIWFATWMTSGKMLYRCGDKPWVPLPVIWGVISYAPLQVLRQYGSKQFVPMTHNLDLVDFSYKGPGYLLKIAELSGDWKRRHYMRPGYSLGGTTPQYEVWRIQKVKNIRPPSNEVYEDETPLLSDDELTEKSLIIKNKQLEAQNAKLIEEVKNLKLGLQKKEWLQGEVAQLNEKIRSDTARHFKDNYKWGKERNKLTRALFKKNVEGPSREIEAAHHKVSQLHEFIQMEAQRYQSFADIATAEIEKYQRLWEQEKTRSHSLRAEILHLNHHLQLEVESVHHLREEHGIWKSQSLAGQVVLGHFKKDYLAAAKRVEVLVKEVDAALKNTPPTRAAPFLQLLSKIKEHYSQFLILKKHVKE